MHVSYLPDDFCADQIVGWVSKMRGAADGRFFFFGFGFSLLALCFLLPSSACTLGRKVVSCLDHGRGRAKPI
jgi:hypothetical protein